MTVTFDDKGLVVDSQDDVFNQMVTSAKSRLAPYLQGTELQTDANSVVGRLLRIVSVPAYSNGEILQTVMNQFDVNTAEGVQLDYLGWNIHRIKRLGLAQATGMVVVAGDIGVIISEGSLVSNNITGDSFSINDQITFSKNNAVGIVIRVDTVEPTYSIPYSINSYLSSYPPIEVMLSGETTVAQVAQRISDAINNQTDLMRATVNNDNTITVLISSNLLTGDFDVSAGLSIIQSYHQAYISSVTYQSVFADIGAISKIQSPVLGWRSVYNYLPVDPSRAVETDEEYRTRINLCRGFSVGSYDALWMRMMSVKGVSFVSIKENLTANPSGGIINSGIAVTVQGGLEEEIAQALYDGIPVGIMTSGTISRSVKDLNGGNHTVYFSRPVEVPIEISMSIVAYKDFPANGKQLIKQAITDWFNSLRSGDDIYYSRLYDPINSVRGFSVSDLKIGKVGEVLGVSNINIEHNEIPVVSPDRIFVGGI